MASRDPEPALTGERAVAAPAPEPRAARRQRRFHRRRWRWRRRVFLFLLALVAAAAIAYQYFTSSERVAQIAAHALEDLTGAQVKVESAHFGLNGVIALNNVEFRVPGLPGGADKLFTAEQVLIRHDLWGLMHGHFEARDIVILRPTIYVTDVLPDGKYNFQYLKRKPGSRGSGPTILPQVYLSGGEAIFGQVENNGYTERARMAIGGSMTDSEPGRPGASYTFALYQASTGVELGPMVVGRFEYDRARVVGHIDRLAIDSPQRALLPRSFQRWWDQLRPEGVVPTVGFRYDPDGGFSSTIELRNVGVTLPLGDDYETRLLADDAHFAVTAAGLEITDLSGRVEDFGYHLTGRIAPEGAAFELMLDTDGRLPKRAEYISRLPRVAQQLQRMFDPGGMFDGKVTLTKAATSKRVMYDGVLHIHEGSGWYWRFPYALHDVTGDVHFANERVEVIGVHGTAPSGADITIDGVITPPNEEASVDLRITALGVPLDEHLYESMSTRQRMGVERYLDQDAERTLTEAGVIQSAALKAERDTEIQRLEAQRAAGTATQPTALVTRIAELRTLAAAPVYEVGGSIDATIDVVRPFGPHREYTQTLDIDLAGVNGMMNFWPYPMHVVSGHMLVKPGSIITTGVEARGPFGAVAHAAGGFTAIAGDDEEHTPSFTFRIDSLALDPLLRASLPKPYGQWMRQLELTGTTDITGTIKGGSEKDKVDLRLAGTLRDGRVQPLGGRLVVDQLAGDFAIGDRSASVTKLTGRSGASSCELSGSASWTDQTHPAAEVHFAGKDLRFEDPFLDAIPPDAPAGPSAEAIKKARELLDALRPAGTFDTTGWWKLAHGQSDYAATVEPHALAFNHGGHRIDLSNMTGSVSVTPGLATLDKVTADFGEGAYGASGAVRLAAPHDFDLTLDARAHSVDAALRSIAPEGWIKTLDEVKFAGGYSTRGLHAVQQDGATAIDGTVALDDAELTLGVPIRQLTGDLDVKLRSPAPEGQPAIDATLSAKAVRVADRLLAPLSLHAVSPDLKQGVKVSDLKGQMYGGTVEGEGAFLPGERDPGKGVYSLKLTMTDVALDPFLHPEADGRRLEERKDKPTGKLSGNITAEGSVSDAQERRGRGEFQVREARLYELPVAMTMLNLVNLSLDDAKSFDRAAVQYVIDGDTVMLDLVRFQTPGVQIAGSGTMKLSTRALDLQMYSRNPKAIGLGPIGDMANMFKDELLSIHVGGTMDKPDAKVQAFSGTVRTWDEIWGGKKPDTITPIKK